MIFAILLLFPIQTVYGEIIDKLGIINELLVSGDDTVYFFERDMTKNSPTWIPDTKIMIYHEGEKSHVSESFFIFPTELHEFEESLFFAALSPSCIGMITCDYQDVFRMSKIDGSYEKIIEGLKSAIHISVEDKVIYISESNGRIWKMNHDGYSPKIIFEGNNIIMDLAASQDIIYWIEEEADLKNHLMRQSPDSLPEVIQSDIQIPYGLVARDGTVFWNDIIVKPGSTSISEFTVMSKFENEQVKKIAEFQNTSPITKGGSEAHYDPYLIYGDFIVLSNNTVQPVIQLIDINNEKTYDLQEINDYSPHFLRSGTNNLYVVGENNDGFVIEKILLPIPIPEFSNVLLFPIVAIFLSLIIFAKKLFHYEIPPKTL